MDYQNEEIIKRGYQILRMMLGMLALILGSYFFHSILSSYFKFNNIQVGFNTSFIWFFMFCCSVGFLIIISCAFIFGILDTAVDTISADNRVKTMKGGNTTVKFQTQNSQISFKSVNKSFESIDKIIEEAKKKKAAEEGFASVDAYSRANFDTAKKSAERGDITAQYELGMKYRMGEGIQQDFQEAKRWIQKAAEQGYAEAQYFLGLMHYIGKEIPKDNQEAKRWFQKAAEQGHAEAQSNLETMF
ncbi:MAG: sel1 repeat family protein [Endomicrobium sp.]|jgi:hypothetical protein|nr:sel1 repeat family protein [Endomicrobium sp.]